MADLNEYLAEKREALASRNERLESGTLGAHRISARVSAEGRSGIRRIRIRDFQVVTDSPPDFAGYDLGPSSPELQLGVLGSCLTHSYLIQAARLGVEVESLSVEVESTLDPRAGRPGFESVPFNPHEIAYTVHIVSPAPEAAIAGLEREVQRVCPILNLIRTAQTIRGTIDHRAALARNDTRAALGRAA